MTTSNNPQAVVIGAGPYGLAAAAHLIGRGVSVRVFGEPMSAWLQNMPRGMFLKSEPSASSISAPNPGYGLADYCRAHGITPLQDGQTPVPIELFTSYGSWFQEQLVPVERERITNVTGGTGRFEVTLANGEVIQTPTVLVASGHIRYAFVPTAVARLAAGEPLPTAHVSHTSHHPDLSKFAGQEVAVIGAGQSALESAALLHEAGAGVHLLVRAGRVLWASPPDGKPTFSQKILKPSSGLGDGWSLYLSERCAAGVPYTPARFRLWLVRMILGPAGAWWLRERVEGKVDVRLGDSVRAASLQADKVVLETADQEGRRDELVVDHVLAASGYKVEVDRLEFLDPQLRARITRVKGFPALDKGFMSSVPGLYFVGLPAAATFGPLMRFVCGTDMAAPRVAAALASRV